MESKQIAVGNTIAFFFTGNEDGLLQHAEINANNIEVINQMIDNNKIEIFRIS